MTKIILPNKLKLIALEPTHKNQYSLIMKEVRVQLKQYFQGDLKYFNLKTDFHISPFYNKALKEVSKITYATTRSYKKVANNIGSPNGHRAVANANAKNPIPIVIPCHRVIKSNGELGGYGGGSQLKKDLLKFEKANLNLKAH